MGIKVTQQFASFRTSYSDKMIDDPNDIIERFRKATHGVKYDTIVGRGSSGMLIVPVVARALRKKWFVVRKEEEVATSHSGQQFLGDLGRRWIFLDDFVSSGKTFQKTREGVRDAVKAASAPRYEWYDEKGEYIPQGRPVHIEFDTELVGYFEYEKRMNNDGWHLWNEQACPGYTDYIRDTPYWKAEQKREEELRRQEVQAMSVNRQRYDVNIGEAIKADKGSQCPYGNPYCNCAAALEPVAEAEAPRVVVDVSNAETVRRDEALAELRARLTNQAVDGVLVRQPYLEDDDNTIAIRSWGDVRPKSYYKPVDA